MNIVLVLIIGFILDMILGDPKKIPHPIVFIGKLISIAEKIIREILPKTIRGERIGGLILWISVVSISTIIPAIVLYGTGLISYGVKEFIEIFWCWQILACKSLKQAAERVKNEIDRDNIEGARKYLSWIVGRDTKDLNYKDIIKAVCETVAENCSDGVIAPMIFIAVGGIPAGFFYKACNTLDSMIGYKNSEYINFGKFSAIIDDIVNYIPARITGVTMCIAANFVGLDGKSAWSIFLRDRKKHVSPNAGNPEAATAGALGVELLGNAVYFGKLYEKEYIGDNERPIEAEDITRTNKLMVATSCLCLFIIISLRLAIFYLL